MTHTQILTREKHMKEVRIFMKDCPKINSGMHYEIKMAFQIHGKE